MVSTRVSHAIRYCKLPVLAATFLFGLSIFGARSASAEIYLGDPNSTYVDITENVLIMAGGTYWVVGYNNEDPFQITINAAGEVLDPVGSRVGFVTPTIIPTPGP